VDSQRSGWLSPLSGKLTSVKREPGISPDDVPGNRCHIHWSSGQPFTVPEEPMLGGYGALLKITSAVAGRWTASSSIFEQ